MPSMTYYEELQFRTLHFDNFIQAMVRRRSNLHDQDIAVVFAEPDHTSGLDNYHLRCLRYVNTRMASVPTMPESIHNSMGPSRLQWRDQKRHEPKFVQFAFMRETFYMEITNNVLSKDEVGRLFRDQHGFYWLRHRRWPWMSFADWQSLVSDWDPVQKEYLNTDASNAARDMAYILFTLWRFPVTQNLSARTLTFWGKTQPWEGIETF